MLPLSRYPRMWVSITSSVVWVQSATDQSTLRQMTTITFDGIATLELPGATTHSVTAKDSALNWQLLSPTPTAVREMGLADAVEKLDAKDINLEKNTRTCQAFKVALCLTYSRSNRVSKSQHDSDFCSSFQCKFWSSGSSALPHLTASKNAPEQS